MTLYEPGYLQNVQYPYGSTPLQMLVTKALTEGIGCVLFEGMTSLEIITTRESLGQIYFR